MFQAERLTRERTRGPFLLWVEKAGGAGVGVGAVAPCSLPKF